MKKILGAILLGITPVAFADCLVELSSRPVQSFVGETCRDALRECNKAKVTSRQSGLSCSTIDSDYIPPRNGGNTGGGPGRNPNDNNGGNQGANIYAIVNQMDYKEQAANRLFENLYVKEKVSGWADQLYINGNFAGNYNTNDHSAQMELKRKIRDLSQYQYPLKQLQELRIILKTFPNRKQQIVAKHFENCSMKLNVSGWATQLYINGNFSGNYNESTKDGLISLKSKVAEIIANGTCRKKSKQEIDIMESSYLIEDMVNRQYRNCYVKPYVSGWAHQLYIRGSFSGNYNIKTSEGETDLRSLIAAKIMDGVCIYDPI